MGSGERGTGMGKQVPCHYSLLVSFAYFFASVFALKSISIRSTSFSLNRFDRFRIYAAFSHPDAELTKLLPFLPFLLPHLPSSDKSSAKCV